MTLSEQDKRLWRAFVRTVKPLWKELKEADFDEETLEELLRKDILHEKKRLPPPEAPRRKAPAPLAPLAKGDTTVMDGASARRFVRGKLPCEAKLDLHGFTLAEALPALASFLENAKARGCRQVLVVTGQGLRTPKGREKTLQQAVPEWLNLASLRRFVLSFTEATPKDGGKGALYVRLKK